MKAVKADVEVTTIPFLNKNGLTYYLKLPVLTVKKHRYLCYIWEFGELEAPILNEEGEITGYEYSHLSDEVDFTDYIVDKYKDIAESLWYLYFIKINAEYNSYKWLIDTEEGDERHEKVRKARESDIADIIDEVNDSLYGYFNDFYKLIRQENSKHYGINHKAH